MLDYQKIILDAFEKAGVKFPGLEGVAESVAAEIMAHEADQGIGRAMDRVLDNLEASLES